MTQINCSKCSKSIERRSPTHKYCNDCSIEVKKGLHKEANRRWKEKNEDYDKNYYIQNKENLLLKSNKYYETNREKLGFKKREDIYSQQENKILYRLYGKMKIEEIQERFLFNRSITAIMQQAKKLGLKSSDTPFMLKSKSKKMKGIWKNPEYKQKMLPKILNRSIPTKLEQKFDAFFKQNNLPFHYVGDGQVILGDKCPDFICNPLKLVIETANRRHKEAFGYSSWQDYERIRKAHFKRYFFDCLCLWEDELKNPTELLNKIQEVIK